MDNETLFYVLGGILVAAAVLVTFIGLRVKSFPGKAGPLVIAVFVALVGAVGTFSVLMAQDHKAEHATETHAAGEEAEQVEDEAPAH